MKTTNGFMVLLMVLPVMAYIFSGSAFAAHPLITDDTGTQGRGKFQLELNGEYGHDKEEGVTENSLEIATILSYGITGIIYSVTESINLDFGIKTGINKPATGYTVLAGIAVRF